MTGGAAPKRKGDSWERDVVAYLQANGHPRAARAFGAGRPDDRGDVIGVGNGDWVIQAKATQRLDLAGALAAVTRQQHQLPYGAAILKRRGHPTGDGYVVMTLETFARLTAPAPADADGLFLEGSGHIPQIRDLLDRIDHQE